MEVIEVTIAKEDVPKLRHPKGQHSALCMGYYPFSLIDAVSSSETHVYNEVIRVLVRKSLSCLLLCTLFRFSHASDSNFPIFVS
jgi:hypothetical protein